MASLALTGKARSRFLGAAVLLHTLDPVRGEPTTHGLDREEIAQNRERFLKRKFLDSFALICATRKGGDSVSAACMEEGQPEGTVVRVARNGGVSLEVLSQARSIISDLNSVACGGSRREDKEADILSKIIQMDISRLRGYICDLRKYQNSVVCSRSEARERVLKSLPDISPYDMEQYLEWLDNVSRMDGLHPNPQLESLVRYVTLAKKAKHNYLEPLNAVFSTQEDNFPRWISILFKLGRYAIASRALVQLAVEIPALFNPMMVETVSVSGKIPFQKEDVSLASALRRLVGNNESRYISRLAQVWGGKDPEAHFQQQCPDSLAVHAEVQLVGFYDLHPERTPSFRFIGVSKKSCYLCDRFLAIHPRSLGTSACHQKLYMSWVPPPTTDSKIYNRYKMLAAELTRMMEIAAEQELQHRLGCPRRQAPAESSCGVSLSGLTEHSIIPVMPGALISSQTCLSQLSEKGNNSAPQRCISEDVESMRVPSRVTDSLPLETTSNLYGNISPPHVGDSSGQQRHRSPFLDMVAHFKRADNFMKQNIIHIADIIDLESQKPSWTKLLEILETDANSELGLGFKKDRDFMMVNDQIIMGNERQLIACLQYLQNLDKLNLDVLVCRFRTPDQAPELSVFRATKARQQRVWKRSKWAIALGSFARRSLQKKPS